MSEVTEQQADEQYELAKKYIREELPKTDLFERGENCYAEIQKVHILIGSNSTYGIKIQVKTMCKPGNFKKAKHAIKGELEKLGITSIDFLRQQCYEVGS